MIKALGYVGFTSPQVEQWRVFGTEVLGAQLADDGPDGAVRLRLDEHSHRVAIHPGERDDLAYLGWDTGDSAGLDAVAARLEANGFGLTRGDDDLAEERRVAKVVVFTDPFGLRHELFHDAHRGPAFTPGRAMAGFVTGDQGIGHIVLIVPELDVANRFYTDILGFVTSDTIQAGLTLTFLHCSGSAARHHTLAFALVPGMVGVHHLMLEVPRIDDVGTALDIVMDRGIPLAMGLGRHTNDLMTSFYVRSPSGFEIEYGADGRVIDDDDWEVGSYDAMSLWGHRPPSTGPLFPGILRPFEFMEPST